MLTRLGKVFATGKFQKLHDQVTQAHDVLGSISIGESARSRKHNLQIAENDLVFADMNFGEQPDNTGWPARTRCSSNYQSR